MARVVVLALVVVHWATAAHAGELILLEPGSTVRGLAADGTAVTGTARTDPWHAFVWTPLDGFRTLRKLPGTEDADYEGVCTGSRGNVVYAFTPPASHGIVRYVDGVPEDLTRLPDSYGHALPWATSLDGLVLTGTALSRSGVVKAFRWTHLGTFEDLTPQRTASGFAISADGSTIAGVVDHRAMYWHPLDGVVTFAQQAGDALGVSWDGRYIVGTDARRYDRVTGETFRLISGRPLVGVTRDGRTLVGNLARHVYYGAFIWTEENGTSDLRDWISERVPATVDVPDIGNVVGISYDGRVLAGNLSPVRTGGWVFLLENPEAVIIPACRGDVDDDGDIDITDLGMMLGDFGQTGTGLAADTNDDGLIDIVDLSALLTEFGGDCSE